jgi:hypothetical protein
MAAALTAEIPLTTLGVYYIPEVGANHQTIGRKSYTSLDCIVRGIRISSRKAKTGQPSPSEFMIPVLQTEIDEIGPSP